MAVQARVQQGSPDYTEAIRLNPNYAAAFTNRASVLSFTGDWDKAISDYTEAVRLNPTISVAYAQRGVMWQFKKDYDKALADFTEAIRIDPKSHAPYCSRAWLRATCPYGRLRDGELAIEDAKRACDLIGWKDGRRTRDSRVAWHSTCGSLSASG